jgi:hypothetical protein
MRRPLILLFFTSCLLLSGIVHGQETNETVPDTTGFAQVYGLRLGADLSKLARTALENGYSGFELVGDFRLTDRFYLAAELGNEKKERFESNLNSIASGSYIKIGGDFNAYVNWLDMNNAIFVGLRYGFSTFRQELLAYGIYTSNQTFPGTFRVDPVEYTGLTASWIELMVGIKTEIFKNLFLSLNLQLKRKVNETKPDNFDNLYIPGFNRTYDFSEFGVGYGYTISYLIPIFKR